METVFSMILEKCLEYVKEDTVRSINHSSTLRTLERDFLSLNAKATDVEAEIKNAELSGQKKRKREVKKWLKDVKKLRTEIRALGGEVQSEDFVSRFLGGDRAAELKERVDKLVEQSKNFGELVLDAQITMGETLLAPRLVGKVFEENLERIWKMLRADNVKSIGIYGMGGVGKTTLIKHINNRLVETTHECVFWVTVSQEYNVRMLQDKIAHVVGVDLSHEYDEDKRAARLYRELSSLRKNFILILDDVWKNISLEKVGIPLCLEGNKLIITTRSLQVCRQIGCQKLIQLKTLDPNEAWKLFSDTLGQEVTLSPQVEEIAKCMAKLCDGLPLGIITLAGSMRGETAIHAWRNALQELRKSVMEHEDMEEQVFKVLKYSYDKLNPKHQEQVESNGGYTELQHCFLYCSLYPEDHKIRKEELVRKFLSEELVDKRKCWGAQVDQVHTILDKLVSVCLLESAKEEGFDCVKMHDLIRAMALKITQGKNMVLAGCLLEQIPNEDDCWTQDVEKISLMFNSIKEIQGRMSPNCPKLSTLLLQGNKDLKFIAHSFFSKMHGLCVLDLSSSSYITKLPNSLSNLESLKALILGNCRKLVNVPYLGKLKALNELDLSYTAIREVPEGMDELVNLKFLSMDNANALEILPTGLLLNFPYLQCLHLPKQIEAPIIEIESLRKLEEFKGRLNDVAEFNRLIRRRPLIKYCVIVGTPMPNGPVLWFGYYNEILVSGCNYNIMEDAAILAHDAQHLGLENCYGLSKSLLDDFPKFNNPKSLNTLRNINCEGVECILANNGDLQSSYVAPPLRTLEEIRLRGLPDFIGIISKQEVVSPTRAQAVFSSLRKLDIWDCNKMKNLGLTGSEFPNLESIRVLMCSEIEEIIEEGGVVSFPKLKSLDLQNLPKLKHVGTITVCHSIECMRIAGCGALKKLPLVFTIINEGESSSVSYFPPPALKLIRLRVGEEEWWETLEWEHPSHKLLLQPFLHFSF